MYTVQMVSTILLSQGNILETGPTVGKVGRTVHSKDRVQLRSHVLLMTSFNTECPHNMAASFPRTSDPRERRKKP